MKDVISPLLSAETVVTERGFHLLTSIEEDGVVGFELPNRYGKSLQAVVEFEPLLNLVQISAQVMEIQVPSFMSPDLMQIINGLNVELPGATFAATFAVDEKDFDEIEVSVSHHLVEDIDPEPFIAGALTYLEGILLAGLPVIYMFLSQKIVYRVNTSGVILSARATLSVDDCMRMIKQPNIGNA